MAAVIKIEVTTTGGLSEVKKEVADLGQTAEKAGGGFSALKEIGVGALRAVGEAAIGLAAKGFQALAGAISDGIADARQNAQIQAQTAAVLKSTGNAAGVSAEHIADYASALSDAAGKSLFGDDQIQQSTNLLLTFTEIRGKALDAATAISVDMAQALGGAPKDAAIQLGKALNDPIKGITALTRVGVTFSEKQKATIQAMVEHNDVAGAQAVILAELNKEFGGSAEAAAKATGGWSEFTGRMGEAKEALGAAVLPLLNQLAGFLNTTILPAVERAAVAFGVWTGKLQPLIDLFGVLLRNADLTTGGWARMGDAMRAVFGDTIGGLLTTVVQHINTIKNAVVEVLPAFSLLSVLLQNGDLTAGGWARLSRYIGVDLVSAIQTAMGVWTTTLQPALMSIIEWFQTALPTAIAFVNTNWEAFKGALMGVGAVLGGAVVAGAISAVIGLLGALLSPIALVVAAAALLGAAWATDFGGIRTMLTDFWTTTAQPILSELVTWLATNIPVAIQALAQFWTGTLQPALQAVWSFIQTNILPILNTLVTVAIAEAKIEIQALALLWTNVLQPALDAVWSFISGTLLPIFAALFNVAFAIAKKEVEALGALWSNVLWPALQKVGTYINGTMLPFLSDLGSKIGTYLGPILDKFTEWLSSVTGGLSGVGGAVQKVVGFLNDLASQISSIHLPAWMTPGSPTPWENGLRGVADALKSEVNPQVGKLMEGLTGLASAAPTKALDALADGFTGGGKKGGGGGPLGSILGALAPAPAFDLAAIMANDPMVTGIGMQTGGGGVTNNNSGGNRAFTYAPINNNYGPVPDPIHMAIAQSLAGV